MAEPWRRAARLACLLLVLLPGPAAADWYFTPFIGWDVAATTSVIDLEYLGAARRKVTFGGNVMLIRGIFGIEADYAFVPRYFQNDSCRQRPIDTRTCISGAPLVARSRVQTATGSIVLAAPLALTRESLRPYLTAGVGWMGAYSEDLQEAFVVDSQLTGLSVGGGAIGMLGNRTGLRFDLRRFTTIDRGTPSGTSFGNARLDFWRATVGVTIRTD